MNQTSVGLDTIDIVIQLTIFADDAILQLWIRIRSRNGSICHLAIGIKVVECCGKQIIGLRYPVTLTRDYFAGTVHVIVVTVNLNQTGIVLDTIHVVIERTIFIDNAILTRIRVVNNHSAVFVKIVERLCKTSVIREGYPVTGVLNCGIIATSKIVVVSIFR